MKQKSLFWVAFFLIASLAIYVGSLIPILSDQPVFATLLDKNTLTDQSNLGGLLTQKNETSNEQTNQQQEPMNNEQVGQQQQDNSKQDSEGEITQKQSDVVMQSINDDKLVERIFPLIVKKLDGPTILAKVDATQLLQKLDGKQLLEKILPYLDVKPVVAHVEGESVSKVKAPAFGGTVFAMRASCPDGTAVSGGYNLDPGATAVSDELSTSGNYQVIVDQESSFDYSNSHAAIECLNLEVGVKP